MNENVVHLWMIRVAVVYPQSRFADESAITQPRSTVASTAGCEPPPTTYSDRVEACQPLTLSHRQHSSEISAYLQQPVWLRRITIASTILRRAGARLLS